MADIFINIGLYIAYIALVAAIVLLLVFAVKGIITNTKGSRPALIGVGILLAIVIIAYVLSPAESGDFYTKYGVSPQQVKIISAGLITTYIIGIALLVLTLVSATVKLFKK